MPEPQGPHGDVTRLLADYAQGNDGSLNLVIPIVYQELKTLARAQLRRSSMRERLQTTALVHEAYEKLVGGRTQNANDRHHFYAIAARAMRQIVIDAYRSGQAARRGGGVAAEPLAQEPVAYGIDPAHMLRLDEALERLAGDSPELARVIDLSCFGGLSNEEIAALDDTTVRTVQRRLLRARAWLGQLLEDAS